MGKEDSFENKWGNSNSNGSDFGDDYEFENENAKSAEDEFLNIREVYMNRIKDLLSNLSASKDKAEEGNITGGHSLTNALLYGPPRLDNNGDFYASLDENVGEAGSDFEPSKNVTARLYGPPEFRPGRNFDPSKNEIAKLYGPPRIFRPERNFEPSENVTARLYGPPEFRPGRNFDPSKNEIAELYGPPRTFRPGRNFEPSENATALLYGPPEFRPGRNFDPSKNEIAELYGPPRRERDFRRGDNRTNEE